MSEVQLVLCLIFFFNDTATTEIYTLSLHDALPILSTKFVVPTTLYLLVPSESTIPCTDTTPAMRPCTPQSCRSEEHTSELQSRQYLVCRLLFEKKTMP